MIRNATFIETSSVRTHWISIATFTSVIAASLFAAATAHADAIEESCKGQTLRAESRYVRCVATCRTRNATNGEAVRSCADACDTAYGKVMGRSNCIVHAPPHTSVDDCMTMATRSLRCLASLTAREALMHVCNARCGRAAEDRQIGDAEHVACVEQCSAQQARKVPRVCADTDESNRARADETIHGSVETPSGFQEAELEVRDGLAIFEGDIIVGDVGRSVPRAAGRQDKKWRWADNTVPYSVDSRLVTNGVIDARVTNAIAHWQTNTPLRFVRRSTEADYVTFMPGLGCSSWVGRQGGQQSIIMDATCSTGNIIHEIGHAAGLWHEHTRTDRDAVVTILWGNIQSNAVENFQRYVDQGQDGVDFGLFDFGSIMLYDSFAFQRAPVWPETSVGPTITRKNGTTFTVQRTALSVFDRAAVGAMYQPNYASVSLGTTPNLCLDVRNGNTANRTPIQVYRCNDTAAQKWTATQGTLRAFGKCADMPYDQDGKGIWLFDCWGGWNQQLRFTNAQIRTMNGQCVTASSSLWQTQLQACGSTAGQSWEFTPSGEIRTPDGKCLDVMYWQTGNGTPVVGHPCNGGANQKWSLGPNGQIRGYGGKCLDVTGYLDQSGTLLQIWDCHGQLNQRWRVRGEIRTLSNKCLEPSGLADWSPVVVHSCDGYYWQKQWTFMP